MVQRVSLALQGFKGAMLLIQSLVDFMEFMLSENVTIRYHSMAMFVSEEIQYSKSITNIRQMCS